MKESKNKKNSSERETGVASRGAEDGDVNEKSATSFNRLSSRDVGSDGNIGTTGFPPRLTRYCSFGSFGFPYQLPTLRWESLSFHHHYA